MVKKFQEFVEEGFLSKTINRAKTGELRKEDGKKVMTEMGVEILLKNYDYDYEQLIRGILDGEDDLGVDLDNVGNYPSGDQRDIKRGTCEYAFMVDNRIVANFQSYENLIEYEIVDGDELSRDDYIHIIEGIVEALKKTTLDRKKGVGYDYECVFEFIDESDVFNYESELSEHVLDFLRDDFESGFEDTFEDAELEYWSYNNYASSIGVRVSYDNLINYHKMRKYVQDFFKNAKEVYEEYDDKE
ncbi:MAG: hypothetical protein NC548_24705 [Lachnospiraceae bacterium]|nr:hypothetical protein [Lachnospiraceae bacterium]